MHFPSVDVNKPFNFDLWAKMAQENPEQFEAMREQAIEQTISQAPDQFQDRLRCLQWRVDQERKRSDSPLGSCIKISKMMWERVSGEGGLLDKLEDLTAIGDARKMDTIKTTKNNIIHLK